MKKEKKENPNKLRKRKIEEMFEMPKELLLNEPKITMIGFSQVLVENYKGILEYEEFFVKINTSIGVVAINGFNMNLEEMTTDDVLITGKIESIDIEAQTDETE